MNLLTKIDRITAAIGKLSAILLLLLLLNVFYDVIMRYLFNDVSIGMQELEWHLYATLFLLGISYTLSQNGHVRVDVIYNQLSPRRQAMIDIGGTLLLLIPFALLISWYGVGFVADSYQLGEGSGDPGGLPYRWVIKAMIPLSFLLLILSSIGFMLRAWQRMESDR
ncbi:MAG: TRAP transporter small permease subunit [Gammaproteobacteria bacterium]|jgi:TRAP-type mannitol/chloroaromatic compound transport system permease small subunit|nr:TRAP transporter small permease subunit [Gammaproteobacteria bacterium]MBT4606914.1 TRAP transporter small permease subunit [Thiotrichales bacterium]MBT3473318.1 TRAP transporter small permease subunit [Gammaproteobacteria bacterium]MBT3967754.1 TRAP transporter small permease subunit [Gammaproteobacteria bacterium]MBT4081375.1 TRAP transporter small permease subunit [Gammaproteobacteria bacterium]